LKLNRSLCDKSQPVNTPPPCPGGRQQQGDGFEAHLLEATAEDLTADGFSETPVRRQQDNAQIGIAGLRLQASPADETIADDERLGTEAVFAPQTFLENSLHAAVSKSPSRSGICRRTRRAFIKSKMSCRSISGKGLKGTCMVDRSLRRGQRQAIDPPNGMPLVGFSPRDPADRTLRSRGTDPRVARRVESPIWANCGNAPGGSQLRREEYIHGGKVDDTGN
jgi:hypothetical protein